MALRGYNSGLERTINVDSLNPSEYDNTRHDLFLKEIVDRKIDIPDFPIDLSEYNLIPKCESEGKNGKRCDGDIIAIPKSGKGRALLMEFKSYRPDGENLQKAINQMNIIGNEIADKLDTEVEAYLIFNEYGKLNFIPNGTYKPSRMFMHH